MSPNTTGPNGPRRVRPAGQGGTPGPRQQGASRPAPVSAAAGNVRKAGKAGAEAAVVGATGGVGKVALAFVPTTLDSPEDRRRKRRNRRIVYALLALQVIIAVTFVSIVTVTIMSAFIGGATQRPVSPGECLSIEASGGGADAPRPTRGSGQMGYPVDPDVPETSGFGPRWGSMHDGLDFGGPIGTPIYSVADGVVTRSGPASGYGNWITIEHNIDGEIVESLYGHMRADGLHVNVGDEVKAGQHIADIGNEGFSTGAHLHFGVYPGGWGPGAGVDPKPWLNQLRERGSNAGGDDGNPAQAVNREITRDDEAPAAGAEGTVTAADWDKLAGCESGRKWDTNTGNGFFGGLQFTQSTWNAFGGDDFAPTADRATREQQMEVANRVLKEQGWGAWPSCTNSKFPELKGLKPAPEGTFAGGDGGDSSRSASGGGEGQDLPKTPAEKGNEDGLQVDTVRGMRLVAERFPEVTTIGGVRADDLPDHPSGRAIDVMVGDNTQGKASGDRVADYFIEHAEALNVDYIIWQQRIWDGGDWSPMASQGGRTADHYDHVHVTFQGGGPPNGDTSYTGVGEPGPDTSAAAPYSPSGEQLSMELSPEQLANIKAIIVASKESNLEPPERAAALGVMMSGYTANFINLDADEDANKVGIFAEAPFGSEVRQQLMNPEWASEKFMKDLAGIKDEQPNWSTDKAVDVLLAVYPEKASLSQELERWEKISTEIVQQLWDDPNAQAGSGLEFIGPDAEECAVGVVGQAALGGGGDLDLSTVPEAFREAFRVASTLCPGYPMSLVASEVYNESGFRFPIEGPMTAYGTAKGPAQFIDPTWAARGKDWNGDGVANVQDPGDAIPSMVTMLCDDRDTIKGWIDEGIVEGNAEDLAIAAYHAGVYAIKNAGGMPATSDGLSTTADYVANTRRNAVKYELPAGASNDTAASDRASISKSDAGEVFEFEGNAGTYQDNVVKAAEAQIGQPYVWGGGDTTGPTTGISHPQNPGGPGFDCSGLTQLVVYRATGGKVSLPRHSSAQAQQGREIPVSEARAGDLVYSPGHVGIVVAPGRMIHAPTFGQSTTEAPIQPGMGARRIVE